MLNKNKKYIIYSLVISIAFFSVSKNALASQISPEKVIELVNDARDKEELGELRENDILTKIAEDKLNDMIEKKYFAHNSPDGKTPWYWYEKDKYDYKYAGENLAMNFTTAESQQKAWMESPTHKKNIMNNLFQEIGVAVGAGEINGKMVLLSVQEFGTLASAAEGANNPKNFSSNKKPSKIEEDLTKPAVLSSRDISSGNETMPKEILKPKNDLIELADNLSRPKSVPLDVIDNFMLVFMLLAMFFIPVALLSSSAYKALIAAKIKAKKWQEIPVKFLDDVSIPIKVTVNST